MGNIPVCRWLALILLLTGSALSQELTAEQKLQLDKIINLQRNLSSGRANSPGTKLTAKEVSRVKKGEALVVGYQLYGEGFSAESYELFTIPITPTPQTVGAGTGLMLAKDGQVLDGPDDPRVIFLPDFVPGEPSRLGLASKDGKERAFVTIVPNPIDGKDHGCSITVTRLLPKFEVAFVEGTGFPPAANIDFETSSSGETHNGKLKADDRGIVETAILPFVKGKAKGQTQVTLSESQCKPKAVFHWGTTTE